MVAVLSGTSGITIMTEMEEMGLTSVTGIVMAEAATGSEMTVGVGMDTGSVTRAMEGGCVTDHSALMMDVGTAGTMDASVIATPPLHPE